MSIFALIHGSMHGGWCWRELVLELERRGHSTVAPDLPCEDADAGLMEYAAVVEGMLGSVDERDEVVWVGHSLGSRTLPVLASRRPRSRMIFLCSVPTAPGPVDPEAFSEMVTKQYAEADFEERDDGARRITQACARRVFFHDCDEATARWAAGRLRWQGPRPLAEPAPFEAWPDVPLHVILTEDDRAIRRDWALAEAARWLSGGTPLVLPGSHSPFLSRPSMLADALVRCVVGGGGIGG